MTNFPKFPGTPRHGSARDRDMYEERRRDDLRQQQKDEDLRAQQRNKRYWR